MISPKIAVALVTDHGYLVPSVAAAASVLRFAPPEVQVYIICDRCGLSDDQRAWVRENHPRLIVIEIDLNKIITSNSILLNIPKNIPVSQFGRFFLPEILTNIDRFIYLDGDILCFDSFNTYAEIDLQGFAVAAAHDNLLWSTPGRPTMPKSRVRYRAAIGVPLEVAYFNSGAMIIDAAEFRRRDLATRSLQFYSDNAAICRFTDQSALNAVLKGDFLPLSPWFNWQEAYQGLFDDDAERPVFVHFSGGYKPWSAAYQFYPARYRAAYEGLLAGFPESDSFLRRACFDQPIFRKAVMKGVRRILKLRGPRYGTPMLRRRSLKQAFHAAVAKADFPDRSRLT